MALVTRKRIGLDQVSQLISRSKEGLWQICEDGFQKMLNTLSLFGELSELIAAGVPPEKIKLASRNLHINEFCYSNLAYAFHPMAYGACRLAIALGYRGDILKKMFCRVDNNYNDYDIIINRVNHKTVDEKKSALRVTKIHDLEPVQGIEPIRDWLPAMLPKVWPNFFWREFVRSPFLRHQTQLQREEIVGSLENGCGKDAHLVLFPADFSNPWTNHLELGQEELLAHQRKSFRGIGFYNDMRWATAAESIFLIVSRYLASADDPIRRGILPIRAPISASDKNSPFVDIEINLANEKKNTTITIGPPGSFGYGCLYSIPLLIIC
ncbi:MAG: hypothetical protein PHP25_00855 [Candidatus Moranbacteria bacterium]|nr:hypothetical protein [Candidatus Moranbacteria bacterium]